MTFEKRELIFYIANDYEFELDNEDIKYFSERKITKSEPVFLIFSYKIEDNNYVDVGYVQFDLKVINRNAYITYYIRPEFRGKGLGKIVLSKAIDFAFKELNLHRLTAEVYEYNEPSIRLLKSLRFEQEGILKQAKYHDERFWDIIIMGLLRENWKR
ncbi:GNAT family N-acetyltransferase [Fervidobacterium sp.]